MSHGANFEGNHWMKDFLRFSIFALAITIGGLKVPAWGPAWERGLLGLLIMDLLIEVTMLWGIFRFVLNRPYGYRMIYLALWFAVFESIYVMSSYSQEDFGAIVRVNSIIEIMAALLLGLMVLYHVISCPK